MFPLRAVWPLNSAAFFSNWTGFLGLVKFLTPSLFTFGYAVEGMAMTKNVYIKDFIASESGAVTVDWVVLTASIAGLGLAVMFTFRPGATNLACRISGFINGIDVTTVVAEQGNNADC